MTTQTEALRLALEALEHEAEIGNDDAYRKEREAIKEALAQPEQEPVVLNNGRLTKYPDGSIGVGTPAKPEQKPVAHHPCKGMNCGITRTDQEHSIECQAEHAAAIAGGQFVKPEQNPKCGAIIEVFGKDWRLDYMSLPVGKHKLYTQQYTYISPPQRTWVGLTQTEVVDLLCEYNKLTGNVGWQQLIYITEAKLKEKNT